MLRRITGHPTGDRTFVLRVGRCLVAADFGADVHRIYTPSGDLITVGEPDGIDWRTILMREKEYRTNGHANSTAGFLAAVDAVLHGQDVLSADECLDLGVLDDGRAG